MNLKRRLAGVLVLFLTVAFVSCRRKASLRNRLDESNFPPVVLWAWERPEDFRKFDSKRFAVAFLAQTLTLRGDEVTSRPRHQPLQVSPDTRLIAVTRIESQKSTGERAALSDSQRQKLAALIVNTRELENVSAIQVDFDAVSSEREFYRGLILDLRQKLPDSVPLSITALASFCVGDPWLRDLPVDEAVPMIFRMGADDRAIKNLLASGDDFREPLCRRSYGVAFDEPLAMKFDAGRRVYVFNDQSWKPSDMASISERNGQ